MCRPAIRRRWRRSGWRVPKRRACGGPGRVERGSPGRHPPMAPDPGRLPGESSRGRPSQSRRRTWSSSVSGSGCCGEATGPNPHIGPFPFGKSFGQSRQTPDGLRKAPAPRQCLTEVSSCRSETCPSANLPAGDLTGARGNELRCPARKPRSSRGARPERAPTAGVGEVGPAVGHRGLVTARAARRTESERYCRVEAALRCRSTVTFDTVSRDARRWKSSKALPRRRLCVLNPATSTPADARAREVSATPPAGPTERAGGRAATTLRWASSAPASPTRTGGLPLR